MIQVRVIDLAKLATVRETFMVCVNYSTFSISLIKPETKRNSKISDVKSTTCITENVKFINRTQTKLSLFLSLSLSLFLSLCVACMYNVCNLANVLCLYYDSVCVH